ncbi:NAD(P)H-dependent oxidoreductase [Sphingorhabdus sp. Alg239-R122]|uniref:flavodoxin family protein n=1 Tax=Sphingorhabdus sp. Alg239-R122 TaxID=2305989 RepID=UPI001F077150|nr:NAD(P)H-dependent oxidoreductase [Sphingorhabdus sp. Alg239-R122]
MKTLLIVYYSKTGGSAAMARSAAQAAQDEPDVRVILRHAGESGPEDMLAADGYLFICPENLAAIAGGMKLFLDECYYPVLGRIQGRPYAAMICAGSDGKNAMQQLERIATGWRLRKVADTQIVCTHAQTPEQILKTKTIGEADLMKCRETGKALATGLALGVF